MLRKVIGSPDCHLNHQTSARREAASYQKEGDFSWGGVVATRSAALVEATLLTTLGESEQCRLWLGL